MYTINKIEEDVINSEEFPAEPVPPTCGRAPQCTMSGDGMLIFKR